MTKIYTSFIILFFASSAIAAEIKNVSINHDNQKVTITYDLYGRPGERTAIVKVALTIDEQRYKSNTLSLSGDYGANTPVGRGKKIIWHTLKDMPAGYQGALSCELDIESDVRTDPFNILGLKNKIKNPVISDIAVSDPSSGLTWITNINLFKRVYTTEEAIASINIMNKRNYGGYDDWRLPKKDELESLKKLLTRFGYVDGQSMSTYMNKLGFNNKSDITLVTADKSSQERSKNTSNYNSNTIYGADTSYTGNRSASSGTRSTQSRYNGAGSYSGSVSIDNVVSNSGAYSLIFSTFDGYFYKAIQPKLLNVVPIRGSAGTEIFAVKVTDNVEINPI